MRTPTVAIVRNTDQTRVVVDLGDFAGGPIDALWRAAVAVTDEAKAREADEWARATELEHKREVA